MQPEKKKITKREGHREGVKACRPCWRALGDRVVNRDLENSGIPFLTALPGTLPTSDVSQEVCAKISIRLLMVDRSVFTCELKPHSWPFRNI